MFANQVFYGLKRLLAGLVACAALIFVNAVPSYAAQIYWSDWIEFGAGARTEKIHRANLDGSNMQDVITGIQPLGIAVDPVGGHIYWTNLREAGSVTCICRADLDGMNAIELVTADLNIPTGIVLDVSAGKMYWSDQGARQSNQGIHRANLDGTNVEQVVSFLFSSDPAIPDIGLDIPDGKIYWTSRFDGTIWRANLDGFLPTLLVTGLHEPYGMALDLAGGKMYWAHRDHPTGEIRRANLNGTNVEDLVTGLFDPTGTGRNLFRDVTLDLAGNQMFFTGNRKIQRANLDGTNVQDVVTRLGHPVFIVVVADVPDPLAGDYNNNGVVDAADYTVWRDNLGSMATLPNDPTPGQVRQADYDVWKMNFGMTLGAGAGSSSITQVPEPSTTALALFAWLIVCAFRRRP